MNDTVDNAALCRAAELLLSLRLKQTPTLLVGRMPPDMPRFPAPPQGSLLLGSMIDWGQKRSSTILRVPGPPDEISTFFFTYLQQGGWSVRYRAPRESWFEHHDGLVVRLRLSSMVSGMTDVWLLLLTESQFTLRGNQQSERLPTAATVLDAVSPPAGETRLARAGRIKQLIVTSSYLLEEEGSAARLLEHYHGELVHTGWLPLAAGHDGALDWSVWRVPDPEDSEPWHALMTVLTLPWAPRKYRLDLETVWVDPYSPPAWLPQEEPLLHRSRRGLSLNLKQEHQYSEKLLIMLVERLLDPFEGLATVDAQGRFMPHAPVLVRELPPAWPETLPVPDGQLLLSRQLGPEVRDSILAIVLTARKAEQTLAAYERVLHGRGWQVLDPQLFPEVRAGIHDRDTRKTKLGASYMHSQLNALLGFMAEDESDVSSHVVLTFIPNLSGGLAEDRENSDWLASSGLALLPVLNPPDQSVQRVTRTAVERDGAHQRATITTPNDFTQIIAHYTEQLVAAGWRMDASGTEGSLAWSTWTVHAASVPSADGRLCIVRSPFTQDEYWLDVQCLSSNNDPSLWNADARHSDFALP